MNDARKKQKALEPGTNQSLGGQNNRLGPLCNLLSMDGFPNILDDFIRSEG
jgi:hypothetical protein